MTVSQENNAHIRDKNYTYV